MSLLGSGEGGFFADVTGSEWLNAGSSVLSSVLGSSAPPSTAISSADGKIGFDSSGWTVATGGSKANGANTASNWPLYALAALVAIVYLKHKAKK